MQWSLSGHWATEHPIGRAISNWSSKHEFVRCEHLGQLLYMITHVHKVKQCFACITPGQYKIWVTVCSSRRLHQFSLFVFIFLVVHHNICLPLLLEEVLKKSKERFSHVNIFQVYKTVCQNYLKGLKKHSKIVVLISVLC